MTLMLRMRRAPGDGGMRAHGAVVSARLRSVRVMETWIAVVAAVAAVAAAIATAVSGKFVRQQVSEMKRQSDLQQAIAEGSSSPYVWADVRLQSRNGWNLEFRRWQLRPNRGYQCSRQD